MGTYFHPSGLVTDAVRMVFSIIDGIIYSILAFVTAVFYNVANAQLISGTIMHDFFSRIQLILGIIVMFKVATSLFMGIINPETISDSKKGFGGVIKRVIIVLIMIVLIVPLDIPGVDIDDISTPGQTSWNARMNASGIAFGSLFELQSRLLRGHVIERLILGQDGSTAEGTGETEGNMKSGLELSRIIFKCFFTINTTEDGDYLCPADTTITGIDDTKLENAYDAYNDDNSTPEQLLALVNLTCDDGGVKIPVIGSVISVIKDIFTGGSYYAFNYSLLLSTIVGVFCVFVMISYTVDAAIRLVKLMILYLISPVPILSYLDPKSEKNFQNWLKVVGSTYLDLFIRLAIVYIIIFLISEIDKMITNGFFNNDIIGLESGGFITSGPVGLLSRVFIYLGLFMFAREAPKFITDTLGLKQTSGLFGGLTSLMGGISSGIQGFKASQDAMEARGDVPKTPFNRFKSAAAGLVTGMNSSSSAYKDYAGAKDHKFRTTMDKINQQNAIRRANAMSGVSFRDSIMAQAQQDFTGDSTYDRLKREKTAHEKDIKGRETKIQQSKAALQQKQNNLDNMTKIMDAARDTVKKKNAKVTYTLGNGSQITTSLEELRVVAENALHNGGKYEINGTDLGDASYFKKQQFTVETDAANRYLQRNAVDANGDDIALSAQHEQMLLNATEAYKNATGLDFAGTDYMTGFDSESKSLNTAIANESFTIQKDEKELENRKTYVYVNNNQTQTTWADQDKALEKAEAAIKGPDGKRGGQSG